MLISELLSIISVFAAAPLALALPADTNYASVMLADLGQAIFSTDPASGRVAASTSATAGDIQFFMISNESCVEEGDAGVIRAVVRNNGLAFIDNIVVTLEYPINMEFMSATPPPTLIEAPTAGIPGLISWVLGPLDPGHANLFELQITFKNPGRVDGQVDFDGGHTVTSFTLGGICGDPALAPGQALPPKQPAIICDPAEINCVNSLPNLGLNFQAAKNAAKQVNINETGAFVNRPKLGPRFAESLADIIPGECRVLADDIITDPAYHDSLNRRSASDDKHRLTTAPFLRPLFTSGYDFWDLTQANEMLGIRHLIDVQTALRAEHTTNWQEYMALLDDVIAGRTTAASFTASAQNWKQRVRNVQAGFLQSYQDMQNKRSDKFDPVAAQAVINARTSIGNACGIPDDAGLAALLAPVKAAYDATLQQRITAFITVQINATANYNAEIDRWGAVMQALNAADNAELKAYKNSVQADNKWALNILIAPYASHQQTDVDSDNRIRLEEWERALDTPKSVATGCQKELDFGGAVKTTWCESGKYPEFINADLAGLVGPNAAPPVDIPGGDKAIIKDAAVEGVVCGEGPGDPYWFFDCRCKCNELIACPTLAGQPLVLCQLCPPGVTRHDVFVQTQAECFNDAGDHSDPFF